MNYSDIYNRDSYDALTCAMAYKNSHYLHFPSGKDIKLMITDMDHHPYRRFFRGEYKNSDPIIHSRYAGYRPYLEYGCFKKCN